jgi:YHS domain-containing protein
MCHFTALLEDKTAPERKSNHPVEMKEENESMEKDLICGMAVNEKTAKHKSDYKGKTYYFCSQFCKAKFDKDPSKFANK